MTEPRDIAGLSPEQRALLMLRLRRKAAREEEPGTGGIPRAPREGPLPLSFAQQRLWFLDRWAPESPAYNIPAAVLLHGDLDASALAGALAAIVQRHETLRTTFPAVDGEPRQVIAPPGPLPVPVVDLTRLPGAEGGEEGRRLAQREARIPFDLARGPLLRIRLLRLARREHLLLVNMHHIVSDGWSVGVLIRELSELYAALLVGRPAALPPLPVQYADFAVWQRRRLQGEELERQLAYWRERLGDPPEPLELPTDRPRPAARTFEGRLRPFVFPEGLWPAIDALCQRQGTTPFMVLLAGFAALLQRLTGRDEMALGTPIANRNRQEIEGLIGFFVNLLVLRADLTDDPTFGELLARVREETLGAYSNQDLPFEKLVEELQPERRLDAAPLFQVSFSLQNAPLDRLELPGLELQPLAAETGAARFDLGLDIVQLPDGALGRWEYAAELFDATTLDRMSGHLCTLLAAVTGNTADPGLRLSELPLLTQPEIHQLLADWNDTEAVYEKGLAIHELLELQAAARPDAVAIVAGDEQLTYAGLVRESRRLARHLRERGAGPDTVVGVSTERSLRLPVAMLGILQAGGAYLPLDPSYPEARLALMREETGARIVLDDAVWEAAAGLSAETLPAGWSGAAPEGLAYVLYTSGSTGRPKGVAVPHQGVLRLTRGGGHARLHSGFDGGEVILQVAPASFDASTLEIWGALLNGGRLVMMPPGRPTIDGLADALVRHGVTTLLLTSGLFHAVVDERLDALAGLRQIVAGGDVVSPTHVRRAVAALSGCDVWACYGPTEVTTFTSCHPSWRGHLERSVPIGRPIADTRVFVLDRRLLPVPVGVVGELAAGGIALARGYLGRPDLTAERFVPDAWSGEPGERLYRTGDLVKYLPDGTLEFLGRVDNQVKLRGFRVEPQEVEAVLLDHPAVAQAAVLVLGDSESGRRLLAFVQADGVNGPREDLRSWLRERVPDFMVPSAVVAIPEMPLTSHGKVDRRALSALAAAAPEVDEETPFVPLHGPVEEVLGGIWAEVLRRDRVGARDGFFDLGGHSLLAIRVLSRVRQAFGIELPLRALFEEPTVSGLARRIERSLDGSPPPPPIVPMAPAARDRGLPLSFAQQRLWFIDQLEPDSAVYNTPLFLLLTGALDVPALAAAFAGAVERHEVLRTTFAAAEGSSAVQVIGPPFAPELPVIDLQGLPAEARGAEARRLATLEAGRPFDLRRGPILRLSLLRLSAAEHALLVNAHHIATDAWSMEILWREVSIFYEGFRQGRPATLPPLPIQYADFAVWQRGWLQGEVLESQLDYWRRRLGDDVPVVELPADRPRPAVQSYRGADLPLAIPPAASAGLLALSRREGATPFMTLLALFVALLGRMTGQRDLPVGTPISGRRQREVEGLVGFFLNTLVIRAELPEDATFRELVGQVRTLALEAYAHQDVPFEKLVDELRPRRSLSHSPLFQVLFVLLHQGSGGDIAPEGLAAGPFPVERGTSKFDLMLALFSGGAGGEALTGTIEYATDLFDRPTIARLAEHLGTLASAVAAAPDGLLSALPLLGEAERHQLLAEWNDTAHPLPELSLHQLFERQAERTPDAAAATFGDHSLTYAELARRAARLARHLRRLGIGPESLVGLGLDRSLEMVTGVLGVLTAGAAYVPLDPALPRERRAYMLENAGVEVLLTRSGMLEEMRQDKVRSLCVDGPALEGPAIPPGTSPPDPGCLAYVIYTSGSTGRPKGVGLPRLALSNLIDWHLRHFLGGVRTLQFASLSFDVSFLEMFACWGSGGTLLLISEELRRDVPALARFLVEAGAEKAVFPVVVLQRLAEEYAERGFRLLPPLAEITTMGEQLQTSRVMADLLRSLGGCAFHNHYGPSESHVVTAFALDPDPARWPTHPSIGLPIANSRVHLLDERLAPVPVGVPGELAIGGVCLARGYVGRPDLTAEKFVPDPFAGGGDEPGARLYRTGDKVRRLPDGNLDFLGRFDHQVKVRGFRVEPEEIESVLGGCPGVRQTVVLARRMASGGPGDTRLVAYVVPEPGAGSPGTWRAFLREKLPDYMVPSHFVELEAFPLNANGKVDRGALPAPSEETARPDLAAAYVAPRTPIEETLAAIWSDVLGIEQVGAEDDFFELGGQSLLATQAISRVRHAFGVEIPLRALFEGPTIAELARVVEAERGADGPEAPPLVPMPPAMRTGELPLSFAQQRLWFLDRLVPDNPFYNMFGAVRLAGPVDVPALREACREIARRHEVLRTTFPSVAGMPVQAIAAEPPPGFPLIDLGGLPGAARRDELERLAFAEGQRPFDLTRGPVFRTALLRLGETEHSLFFNVHHIASDGWSLGVLHRDLAALYGAFHRRQPSPLPRLPIQYADFAVWQRGWLQGEALRARLDYWRRRLDGMPEVLELPTDRPRPAVESFRGASVAFPLAAPLVRQLSLLARRRGATLSMVVLAGFKALLARLSGRGDIPVGVAIAGRNRRETEELIGFFVNTLVLRTHVSGSAGGVGAEGFGGLVARVRETSLGAYAHQDLPFEKLVEELAPDRDLGRNPLVQVTFGFHNFPRREVETGGLVLIPPAEEAVGTGTSKFDLSLHFFEVGAALQGSLEYNLDLFDEPTARRFTGHLAMLLTAAVEDPESPPELLPLLSEAESHQLLTDWNDTASPYERDLTVHEVFDLQVEERPDAVAVVAGDEHLSYRGLALEARRLASHLREMGVGPEEIVGLRAERSAFLPAAMLGILQAGAAYLPLDPEAPEERLALMREEAGVRFVVSQGEVVPPASSDQEGGSPFCLAYVIYTSGSTGRPKGVAVPHRGIVRLVRQAGYARLDADETILQVAPVSFDASTFEIWGALLNGSRLVMMPPEKPTLDGIGDALVRYGVTTLHLTAGLFHAMVEERLGALAGLRQLLTGGDVLSASHVRRAAASLPGCDIIACYGPTEGTTFTSVHPAASGHLETSVPLGRPIGNTRVLVLDRSLVPVPVGVVGDLAVGGDGLARGYLGRPDLTAERFVPDPRVSGERLYLTGDRVRYLADGTLEFLGRFDTQVKVRGFRVEPAEVEAHLAEHPAVRASAVLAHAEERGDRRLVAYVVPDPEYAAAGGDSGREAAAGQVEAWTRIFDDTYRAEVPDATFNTVGWVSTATGLPLSRGEMGEWVEDAVDRILAFAPRRVLEIGCGTGLLLFPIAPRCELYTGTDISPRVLATLEEHLGDLASRVRLLERPADRFDGIADDSLDLVILNSVVQYFPGADYLATVLERAVAAVRPGGAVFLGDVRSLPLLDAFHASVELAQAEPGTPASRTRRRAETRRLQENELVVDPAFFAELARRLPKIGRVEVHPKRGRAHNELTAFRYQVVLRVGKVPFAPEVPWRDWREGMTLEALRRLLEEPQTGPLGVRSIPNARSASQAAAAALLLQEESLDAAGLLARAGEAARGAVDPQDLWDLGRELGWQVDLGWADPGPEGRFEAVFRRPSDAGGPASRLLPAPQASPESRPWSAYTTDPLRGQLARRLAPELRAFLGARLPDYMVPAAFVPLAAMPLTPNGKLDRKALARLGFAADLSRADAARYAAPRTPTEERLAAIWADLLKVPRVGAEDDFFALGGHSLLATQAVSRVRDAFGIELPLRALFEAPTVAGLAAVLDHARAADPGLALPPLTRVPRDRPLPLSFAQQRLWFLDRLVPDNPFYNMFSAVRLAGAVDVAALLGACREVARRHEVLRTTFAGASGQPFQVIHPRPDTVLPLVDLGGLPEALRAAELERLAIAEGRRPFDLQRGPVFRNALVRLTEAEHSLFLNIHHIAADGWSMGILHRELAALYEAFARRRPSPLPELPVQYADFAVWQRGWLAGEALGVRLDYWRRQLAGMPEVLELPYDHPRPAVESFRGGSEPFTLGEPLVRRLSALAGRRGATLSMVMLAGFKALLARLSGEEDVAVGMAIANRNRREIEDLIGFFVNTLVLRTETGGAAGFGDLVSRVRETSLGAYAHQDLPFERLVEELAPQRELGRNPLVQVMFGFHNIPRREVEAGGLLLLPAGEEEVDTGTSRFDLALHLFEAGGVLQGMFEYGADLFDATTVRHFAGQLGTLLAAAVAEPEVPPALLPLLSEAESHQLRIGWNDTATAYERELTVHELFELQVAARPDAVAVVAGDEQVTYLGLARQARRLARHLRALGVGPETFVGLRTERSAALPAAILGILQAGGAYLPLDPDYPEERLALMAEEAGVTLILDAVHPGLWRAAAIHGADELPAGWSGAGPDNLVYAMYTSGSTGRPKGVMAPHRGVVRLVRDPTYVRLDAGETLLQAAPVSFDASTFEIWGALLNGGRLVMMPPERLTLDGLADTIARQGVTTVHLTTGLFHALVEERLASLAGLRQLLAGGDVLSPAHVRRAAAGLPGCAVIACYGPTEGTTYTSCHPVAAGHLEASVPIGRPIGATRVYVVDRGLVPVPRGVAGELVVGGDGLARGYLGRPELTAERFVPDPSGQEPGGRLYRTGDRVRYLPDGTIEFLGRFDTQVKIRGFRVEPGEVEARLEEHPAVRVSTVLVHQEGPGDRRLVAYAVLDGEVEPSALRAFLAARLPDYMLPAAFVPLAAMPLTPNGKVDRKALARLGLTALRDRAEAGSYVTPRTPSEERLAAIWKDLLRVPRVGAEDDFFELGGHSLLATQAVSRVRDAFGLELPLRVLFETPTVAGLAAVIDRALSEERGPAAPPIVLVPRGRPLPLSYAQERLWFLDRFGTRVGAYNESSAFRLTGRLDVAALRWALDEIVRRHETLRTTFDEIDGLPVQRIAPTGALDLPLVDLTVTGDGDSEARRLAAELALRPFDLARGPLLRGLLVRLGEEDHAVLLALHHIISDGWSIGVFLRELSALYTARLAGKGSPLPLLPIQYADFAVWQRSWLQGEVLVGQIGYWRETLAGLTPLELPTDRPRPVTPGARGGMAPFSLGEELTRAVRDLCRRRGATLFMVLLAAFQALLQRYTGEDDIAVGTPTAGRNRGEVEGLIGFFINMLVLRGDLSGDPGFRALVDRTREAALGAFAHQDVPFEKIVEELQPERDLGRNPLFQVGFQVANAPSGGLDLPGLALGAVPRAQTAAKVDLNLSFSEGEHEIGGLLEYDADLFEPVTALRIGTHLLRLLEGALADPARPLSALPLLAPWEEHQLLAEWNDAAVAAGETPFLERFEEWTGRTPEAPALIFEDEQLTYGALAERVDRLAAVLRELGVGPEVLVGLCLDWSLEILVAILAVWKAGGAYLPLDPSYPRDRLAFMLEDSGVSLVLTEERLAASLPEMRPEVRVIDISDVGEGLAPSREGASPSSTSLESALAYVIYTSGSTGRPKGVAVNRRGLANLSQVHIDQFGVGPGSRVLQVASFSFDASVAKIVGALGTGAALVQARRETWRPGPDLTQALARHEVSFSVMVPPLLSALPPDSPARLPALSFLGTAGEACPAELVARWAPGRRFWNLYGPTEMTVVCTGGRALPTGKSPDMGLPLPNCHAHVVDRHLRPVPVGVPGELLLQGMGLARGYLGRPELTAERFVPDPWAGIWEEPGARLYRTGDLVRRRADGRLDFLGRVDQQVKIRGFRIELGEIEAVLMEHPEVREAAVTVRQGSAGDRRLVAFAVPRGTVDTDRLADLVREVSDHLRRRLPDHMMPSALSLLDHLPLNPNGKVDRKALDRIAVEEGGAKGFVPPRTPVEQVLAGIWAEVLKIGQVGSHDDFFALSGNSLLAAQVASRVRQALGVELPLRRLFERATLGELAAEIEAARGSRAMEPEVPLPPIERQPRGRPLPASLYQEFGWKLQGGPVGALLNMPLALRARGPLDLGALLASLREIVRRHEELRSLFLETGDGLYLEAGPASRVPLPVIDLSALPEERREDLAHRLAAEEATRPFDLSRAPGFRAQVVRLGARDHVLLVTMHHLISDGASFAVFRRELWTLVGAFSRGLPSPLPELPLQPGDFAWWQRRLATEAIAAQVEWWKRRLAGRPPALGLPGDRPRPAVVGPKALTDYAHLPAELVRGLRALARAGGCTVGMVLTATVQVLLHRYTGEVDVVVGTAFAGRNRPELTGLISLFLNTLPVRSDLSGAPVFRDLLLQTRESVLEAYAHQDAPFPRLLAELYPGQAPDRRLLFRVILNVLDFEFAGGAPMAEADPGGLSVETMTRAEVWARYDLALDVEAGEDFLVCHLLAAADLLTPEGLAAVKQDLVTLLEQIVAAPGTPLDRLLPEPHHRPV